MVAHTRLISVALPLPVAHPFTYAVPGHFNGAVEPGMRVLVPFGRKRLTGVAVPVDAKVGEGVKLRELEDVLDEEPSLTEEMLRLTRWIADYYLCGWGEAIRAALPPGTDVRTRTTVRLLDAKYQGDGVEGQILDILRDHPEITVAGLRQRLQVVSRRHLRQLEDAGAVELHTDLRDPRITPRIEQHVRFAPAFSDPDAVVDIVESLRGEKQQSLLRVLLDHLRRGQTEVLRARLSDEADAPASTVTSLVRHGIIQVVNRELTRSPFEGLMVEEPRPVELNAGQQAARDRILEAVDDGGFRTFLVHGITGSGKTEVYIEALKRVREQGKTGIVLVPEIALTPQTVRRFRAHFGDSIAVMHSRMSLGERFDSWRKIRTGEFDIVIGPRSAILAPLSNIGLIVVDEEHEGSYKQFEPDPRYHARDVAVMRAHMNGAVCILGSATPSLESLMNARGGKYELLEMPDRVPVLDQAAATLPTVQVVDLAKEQKRHRLDGAFSEALKEAIAKRLELKEQTILLHNRRGYAPVVECFSCGWSPECTDCAVTLTYHKRKRQLRCHYCGRAWRIPEACPECGEKEIKELGAGTQRVEEELEELFPSARVRRMDLDTTATKGAHHEILDAFGSGEVDILLGTQMIAKGLDFPNVTLVGVVNADTGLLLPDFRSEERTFQLLMQVAGRSGRAERAGEVILQTRNPEHPVIRHALAHDYNGFAEWLLEERRACGYPPFVRLASIEFRGEVEGEVKRAAEAWTDALRDASPELTVLGPEPAFIARLKRHYRYHTIIKARRQAGEPDLQDVLRRVIATAPSPGKHARMAIDIDPVGLL